MVQVSIFDLFAGHEIGRELKEMSAWLAAHRALRCALLKQHRQLGYQELAFRLEDSASFRAFTRLAHACGQQKSVLHKMISAIRGETRE